METPTELSDHVEEAVRAAAHRAGQLLFGSFPVEFVLDVSRVTTYADGEPVAPLPAVAECVPGALSVLGAGRN